MDKQGGFEFTVPFQAQWFFSLCEIPQSGTRPRKRAGYLGLESWSVKPSKVILVILLE